MCMFDFNQEVLDFKNKHNNDFSNYYNLKDIDKDAESLLNNFYKNVEYNYLANKSIASQVIEIAKSMGFSIFTARFNDRKSYATIGISDELKQKYENNKIIILNNQNTDEYILFSLAHMLAHYIYDYDYKSIGYSNTYRIKEAQTDSEIRANRFATAFLMPRNKFYYLYNHNYTIKQLAKIFKVPESLVKVRIQELDLGYF